MAKPAPLLGGELYSGLFTELGKLHTNDKGNVQSRLRRERQNTDVLYRGGLIRSSVEVSVMEMEQRDELI